jgi:type I restriction enzyme S subunit
MNVAQQEWIGELPSGWNTVSLRDVLIERKELNKLRQETNILSVTNDRGVINYRDKGNVGNKASDDIERYKRVYRGDIVANSMNVIIGSVGISPEDGVLSPVYIVMKPTDGVDTRFYDYIFKAKGFQAQLKRIGYGILDHRMRIPWDNLKIQQLPKPDYKTQQKIADFLDTETAQIDNLIAKQERLLETLEEKRRATITHAVTRGLNPGVELKETNIPWLAQIPAHWGVIRLKSTISDQRNGIWGAEPDGGEDDIVCIRVADFDRGNLSVADKKFTKRSIGKKDQRERLLSKGDLLFEKSGGGDNQLVGQIVKFDLDIPAVTSNFVAKLTVNPGYNVDFLVYLHAALYYQRVNYRSIKQTSGIQNIDSQAYFDEKVAIPMRTEQEEIAMYLAKEDKKVAKLKQKIQTQITLLRERRTSLISHAVTGKIKV